MTVKKALLIKNGNLVFPDRIERRRSLFIEGGKIAAILEAGATPRGKSRIIDAKGLFVSPGFIDIHVHGPFGCSPANLMQARLVNRHCEPHREFVIASEAPPFRRKGRDEAKQSKHAEIASSVASLLPRNDNVKAITAFVSDNLTLREMCGRLAEDGITGFLATTVSLPLPILLKATKIVKNFIRDNPGTNLLGMHFEGPFVNPRVSGAQNRKYIRPFSLSAMKDVFSAGKGIIKAMTFAPEVKNGMRLLKALTDRGIKPFIGHSTAGYREIEAAAGKGATHVTHLFNAMPAFHHREPGLIGAALGIDNMTADIIADGIHVVPAAIKLAVEAKGAGKLTLISDGIGGGEKAFMLGGLKVRVRNKEARLENGKLAGSIMGLNDAVRNMIKFSGISLPEAVGMASLNPARVLGIEKKKGSLETGKDADIVIFDKDLKVKHTIIKGNVVTYKNC